MPWRETRTLMHLELYLVRKGRAENNPLALSFDFGEAHLAKHVLSCYFWQVVSFRRAKCIWL